MIDTPIVVSEIDFNTVRPIWSNLLWPGRTSPILPVSTMKFMGGYDMAIRENYTDEARFFGVYDGQTLAGVFSGHPTSLFAYRARGLYVLPNYTGQGIGRALVQAVVRAAAQARRELCWSLPRVANAAFFQRCDFAVVSPPIVDGVEFGPNVYVVHALLPF